MSVSAKDLRDRFDGLFDEGDTSFSDLERLRGLIGDIVIWIEEREASGGEYERFVRGVSGSAAEFMQPESDPELSDLHRRICEHLRAEGYSGGISVEGVACMVARFVRDFPLEVPPLLPRAERRENVAAYAKRLKERGFSLRESAQIIGVSHEQIRLLLKGENNEQSN